MERCASKEIVMLNGFAKSLGSRVEQVEDLRKEGEEWVGVEKWFLETAAIEHPLGWSDRCFEFTAEFENIYCYSNFVVITKGNFYFKIH